MAKKKRTTQQKEVQDYRHDTATRKNNPPAGIAAHGKIKTYIAAVACTVIFIGLN